VRNPVSGGQFRRDVKLAQKRGKDMAKLREVVQITLPITDFLSSSYPEQFKTGSLGYLGNRRSVADN
jgi:mRNA interferase YafQ